MGILLRTEMRLLARRGAELFNPLGFFVLVCALFPLAVSPEAERLGGLAPGVIWVAAVLAVLLSLDSLFRHDFVSGALEQLLFSRHSLARLLALRVFGYWVLTGLPLALLAPVLGGMLHLPVAAWPVLVQSLLLGTPTLVLLGAAAAALTLPLGRANLLLALLVLPLFMPVLIFGSSAVAAASAGGSAAGQLAFLGALLIGVAAVAPHAIAAAVRIAVHLD
ncbi:MAG: heme exporter protein CcmB [Cellvibrionales bacterium]|nr:heme exporter protein CcmB [Cellvibrionales bacterium]